jgi:hypothetical protein
MNRLGRIFSQFSPGQYLRIAVLSIVTLTFANLLFSAMMFEIGYDYKSILFGPNDRFADLVKVSLSYKEFLPHIEDSKGFQSWPDIFKNYYLSNPYGGKEELAQRGLTHFHAPPLSALVNIACAISIAHTQSAWLPLIILSVLYLLAVEWTTLVGIPKKLRTRTVLFTVWFISLLSYPALFLFSRGHFVDGIASLLIAVFLLSLFGRGRADVSALASFAVAVNVRPDATIFILAIPAVLGLKSSIKPILRFAAFAFGIITVSYFAAHALYPDYSVSTFFQGLETYNRLYVVGPNGDVFNSSLWALVKTVNKLNKMSTGTLVLVLAALLISLAAVLYWGWKRICGWIIAGPLSFVILYCIFAVSLNYHKYAYEVFLMLSVILIAAVCWSLWRSPDRNLLLPFYLTVLYCLVKPVFGDYNLLVFIAPTLLLFLCSKKWAGRYHLVSAIALGSILMLSPKNYMIRGIPIQLLLNPLILFVITLYLVQVSAHRSNSLVVSESSSKNLEHLAYSGLDESQIVTTESFERNDC